MTNTCKEWRRVMGFKNQAQAAEALEYSEAMVKKWEADPENHPVSFSVRLAMSALFHRIPPWK